MAICSSKILTLYGYKNIKDVSIEDKILNCVGAFENQHKAHYIENTSIIIQLKTYSHPEPISCIPAQLFYVRQKKRTWNMNHKKFDYTFEKPIWKHAKDITMNDYLGMIINTSHNSIPEFESYDWFMIGHNFSHYSIIQEWLHNTPVRFVKEFINGFENETPMTYNLALGIQRLYLKAGILSKIVRDSSNRYMVLRYNYASFIEDGYAWYSLQKIKKTVVKDIDIYEFPDSFIIHNIITLSKN